MKTVSALISTSVFFLASCGTVPPGNGGSTMGYPPMDGDRCSAKAAHKYAVPEGTTGALCYKLAGLKKHCQQQIYGDSPACVSNGLENTRH